ncbi:four-carbon acid sugar kinase family protein [bacterium]|nr:four-carbon acid sugar kinase family protein [bacterium]MBR6302026.1 four-carbon acid sugar kinase family protein [bacterium]
MIISSGVTCIIADDLTGANDSALQFHLHGAGTQILLSDDVDNLNNVKGTQTWAISTESRNIPPKDAYERVKYLTQTMSEKFNPDYYFKKIDSTVRGNIAVEIIGMLEVLDWDAAVIIPAFPAEGRVTVGGYHLLRGTPIERTEMARDPFSPICESHLPTMFVNQLGAEYSNLVASLNLRDVMKGAAPIIKTLNELIASGKKLIVVDAVSTTDIEQVLLAMNKSDYKILPAGTAATASILSDMWYADFKREHVNQTIPGLPKLVVSGSATEITEAQIRMFEQSIDFDEYSICINLDTETILGGVTDDLVSRVLNNLGQSNIVVIHTSAVVKNFDGFSDASQNAELTRDKLAMLITDFLAELTKRVIEKKEVILILLGGETSYKCCSAIGATQLQLMDEVAPAIALSMDHNAQWIVTKSGNLGGTNTLIEILNYFERHE